MLTLFDIGGGGGVCQVCVVGVRTCGHVVCVCVCVSCAGILVIVMWLMLLVLLCVLCIMVSLMLLFCSPYTYSVGINAGMRI